jgi:thiamine-phosphate pyrophosphorylase
MVDVSSGASDGRLVLSSSTPKDRISSARLYGILDLGYVAPGDVEHVADGMCKGGVEILQLRAKGLGDLQIEELGHRIQPIAAAAGVPFIINDHPELVPGIGADGAHIGQEDLALADARWRAGRALAGETPPPIIGKSTHSLAQAVAAAEEGADYIGFGPLFPTPTKAGRPAIGLDDIARAHELVSIPIFCIGGVKLENLDRVLAAGARRVVIVSGILQAPDIAAYCRAVKAALPGT